MVARAVLFVWPLLFLLPITLTHAQPFHPTPDRAESFTRPAGASDEASPYKYKARRASDSPPAHPISIGPVSEDRMAAETGAPRRPGTPHKIGFGRDVPQLRRAADTASRLQWQVTPQGGKIAAISVTSAQATGIRLGVLVRRLPPEAVLRFYPQGAGAAFEMSGREVLESIQRNLDSGDKSDEARTYWSPHIEGEETTLEIELPAGIAPDALEIAIPRVSHFFDSPLAAKGESVTKAAASCEVDVSCYPDWRSESRATAKMDFVKSGSSYLCSGTLLNDSTSSGTPHFLSADHCISTQTVASTLETHWFYRSWDCNLTMVSLAHKTLTGGATLLYASPATDTSFMRLNKPPPSGAVYAGWSASTPSLETSVTGIHHPAGDFQKISFGNVQSFQECTLSDPSTGGFSCSNASQANGEFLSIGFTTGITEGGSSGSGLFASSGASHVLIGQLRGGGSSCSDPGGSEYYGRFDLAYYAAIYQWLNPATTYSLSVTKSGGGSGTVTSSPAGINCGSTCSAPFANGSSVTLTATPASGSTFSGWSGACSGTGASCSVLMNAASSVTATFSLLPSAPTNVTATAGNGRATVAFTPGPIGSGTLLYYTAACGVNPVFFYSSGNSSPITVTGLTNGTAYGCWVSTTSTVGTSGWSARSNLVIPTAGTSADLVVTTVSAPAIGTVGQQITISATVLNSGTASTGAYRLGLYFSTDATVTEYDVLFASCSMAGLAPGESRSCTGPVTVPTSLSPGAYYLGVFADDLRTVSENNEGNNTKTRAVALTNIVTPETGVWWNLAENGRGFYIEANSAGTIFFGSYLYEPTGRATWYSSALNPNAGSFAGTLDSHHGGQTLTGAYAAPSTTIGAGGNVSLTFTGPRNGAINWAGGTTPIQRFSFADNSNPPSFQPQSGAWWNPAESGRGFALEVNGSTVFLGGYMYDAAGNPTWYLSTGTLTGQTYQGNWTEYGNGQSLGGAYVAPTLINSAVGQVSITFSSPTDGVMTLPNGTTIPITRFLF